MPVSISGDGAIDGLAFNSFGDVNIVSPQAGDKLVYDGTEWKNLVGYQYAGTRYYTSSGTFEKADPLGTGDIGLRAIRVRLVGAGGGGGGVAATGGTESALSGGGGGGGYAESFITDIAGLSSSVTVTRGAGGAGGAAGANAGVAGGASSFGVLVAASGGEGGQSGPATSTFPRAAGAVDGGTGTAGDIQTNGGGSIGGILLTGSTAGSAGASSRTVAGGSLFSLGRRAPFDTTGIAGLRGSGGTGVFLIANKTAFAGGAGGDGVVVVDCYV